MTTQELLKASARKISLTRSDIDLIERGVKTRITEKARCRWSVHRGYFAPTYCAPDATIKCCGCGVRSCTLKPHSKLGDIVAVLEHGVPKFMAEVFARITNTKVQRPQELLVDELYAEGVTECSVCEKRSTQQCLACGISLRAWKARVNYSVPMRDNKFSYEANPPCFAYELEVVSAEPDKRAGGFP